MLDDEVGDDLRVRLRSKAVAGLDQLFLEFQIVFDDAVVHHRNVAHPVGMGVGLGRPPVGGPAGVADAHLALQGVLEEQVFQFLQFAQAPADGQAGFAVIADHRHPRRVIAPVLQPFQPVQDDGHGLLGPQISDDAAHSRLF